MILFKRLWRSCGPGIRKELENDTDIGVMTAIVSPHQFGQIIALDSILIELWATLNAREFFSLCCLSRWFDQVINRFLCEEAPYIGDKLITAIIGQNHESSLFIRGHGMLIMDNKLHYRHIGDHVLCMLAPRLQVLGLAQNDRITDQVLSSLVNLQWLDLTGNSVITGTGLRKLTALRSLKLSQNPRITDAALRELTNLRSLTLNENRVITDYAVQTLTKLRSLSLASEHCRISGDSVSVLTRLHQLDIGTNTLITDEVISSLPKLRSLGLANNVLITDAAVARHHKLTSLNLNNNHLITDRVLLHLTRLQMLCLCNNHLISIDGVLNVFSTLRQLDIRDNNLVGGIDPLDISGALNHCRVVST
jgi:hypothetical protein